MMIFSVLPQPAFLLRLQNVCSRFDIAWYQSHQEACQVRCDKIHHLLLLRLLIRSGGQRPCRRWRRPQRQEGRLWHVDHHRSRRSARSLHACSITDSGVAA